MTQQDRDRMVALKKAKKGLITDWRQSKSLCDFVVDARHLITQRQAAEEIGQKPERTRQRPSRELIFTPVLPPTIGLGPSTLVYSPGIQGLAKAL
jgi:hypothetical protein